MFAFRYKKSYDDIMLIYGHDKTTHGLLKHIDTHFPMFFTLKQVGKLEDIPNDCSVIIIIEDTFDDTQLDLNPSCHYLLIIIGEKAGQCTIHHSQTNNVQTFFMKNIELTEDFYLTDGKLATNLAQMLYQFTFKTQGNFNEMTDIPFDVTIFNKKGIPLFESDYYADQYAKLVTQASDLHTDFVNSIPLKENILLHNPSITDSQYIIDTYYKLDTATYKLSLDFLPYLKVYLEDTFQSVVGNSDATSSASITFLEEDDI